MQRTLYTQDHDDFRETARAFIDRHLTPHHEKIVANRAVDREIWLEAGRAGFLGLGVPEQYEGSDAGDYRFSAVLSEELAKVGAAFPSLFGIHFDVVAPYLVELTTEEQRQRWLPRFCRGEIVTAIGMTEPSGGSDLAALKTTAVRSGDGWVLNGSKTFITNGYSADLVVVAARTTPDAGARGITLFGVEADMAGFERGRKLDKVGQPEADTSELFFHDVEVPDRNVIGEVDRGFVHMMERLPQERIGAAIQNIAHARAVLDETLDYVRERKAFGRSIGSMQANSHRITGLVTDLDVTQAFVDACVMAHTEGRLDAVTAAKAKLVTAEVQNRVIDDCVQLFGGYGYMREYKVAQAWMDARVSRIWGGSNEIMREIIGRSLKL